MKLKLRVERKSRHRAPSRAALARWARAAAAGLRRSSLTVGVRIVNEAESAALNASYRGRAGATNVLAFPFQPPPGTRSDLLGDLVVCAPVVNREARAQAKAWPAHWAHMIVHGIMHLRGYDHRTAREAAAMERRETSVLQRLGFADPYA